MVCFTRKMTTKNKVKKQKLPVKISKAFKNINKLIIKFHVLSSSKIMTAIIRHVKFVENNKGFICIIMHQKDFII